VNGHELERRILGVRAASWRSDVAPQARSRRIRTELLDHGIRMREAAFQRLYLITLLEGSCKPLAVDRTPRFVDR